jgi:hypothetical protein
MLGPTLLTMPHHAQLALRESIAHLGLQLICKIVLQVFILPIQLRIAYFANQDIVAHQPQLLNVKVVNMSIQSKFLFFNL